MKRKTVSWFAATFLAVSGSAFGADFTFQVPVEVQRMAASFTDGRVRCAVFQGDLELGTGGQLFSLNNLGAFQGTLDVRVDVVPGSAPEGLGPADAERWRCELLFLQGRGEFQPPPPEQAAGTLSVAGAL